jgi:shikimate dehydrogenase
VPFDPARLDRDHPPVVVDLVYDPLVTPLLAAAEAAGAVTVDGLGMLVHQAAVAFTSWTGVAPPIEAMRAAAAR